MGWNALITIFTSAISLLIGIFLNRFFESRPQLIAFIGHISAGKIKAPNGQEIPILGHSVVIRNVGCKPALNIRIGHYPLPQINSIKDIINIYPPKEHKVIGTPREGEEILIERLVPKEETIITYTYFPGMKYDQINTYIKSDEGKAKIMKVLLQKQYPLWIKNSVSFFALIGLMITLYLFYKLAFELFLCHRL